MIKNVPKFTPPAGATPNELAATGPGTEAAEWQAGRREALALSRGAEMEAIERARILGVDRVTKVWPLFEMHLRALEGKTITAPQIGAGAGMIAGGAVVVFRWKPEDTMQQLMMHLSGGAVLGALAGSAAGSLYERVYGPVRPRISVWMPRAIEVRLRELVASSMEAEPEPWRVEGWRQTWASLAQEYMGTTTEPVIALPAGAPSPQELMHGARRLLFR